ncbi:hypothetical protein J6590_061725 [Homalodisca vitripennis]|nr:hypothetical protein J6590_061725 [Homalodisca vitripennis]
MLNNKRPCHKQSCTARALWTKPISKITSPYPAGPEEEKKAQWLLPIYRLEAKERDPGKVPAISQGGWTTMNLRQELCNGGARGIKPRPRDLPPLPGFAFEPASLSQNRVSSHPSQVRGTRHPQPARGRAPGVSPLLPAPVGPGPRACGRHLSPPTTDKQK